MSLLLSYQEPQNLQEPKMLLLALRSRKIKSHEVINKSCALVWRKIVH